MDNNSLKKGLSYWHIWAIGVGAVVGDGIFLLIAQGAQAAGPSALVSYVLGGILLMIVCMAISEMAVGMPGAGSLHTWSSRMLGPAYGTIAGLCEVGMNIIFLGSVSIAAGAISNYFFQWTSSPQASAMIWAVLLLTIVCGVALSGGEVTGKAQLLLVMVLAGIMVLFSLIGIFSGKIDPANFKPFAPFGIKGMWAAMGMGVYAYMGPLALLTAGDEVKDIVDLPKAMFWAFITVLVLYGSAMAVMLGVVNYTQYGALESPFTVAATMIFGGAAGFIMNIAAWIAAVTCLVGEIFCASRLMFGMAKDGALPGAFKKLANKTQVPWFGIIFSYIIALIIIFIGNIAVLESFYLELSMAGCILGTVCFFLSVISSYRYKQLFYDEWKALPWHLPGRAITIPLAVIGCLLTMYSIFSSDKLSFVYAGVIIILMIVFYHTYSMKNMKDEDKICL